MWLLRSNSMKHWQGSYMLGNILKYRTMAMIENEERSDGNSWAVWTWFKKLSFAQMYHNEWKWWNQEKNTRAFCVFAIQRKAILANGREREWARAQCLHFWDIICKCSENIAEFLNTSSHIALNYRQQKEADAKSSQIIWLRIK